MFGFLVTEALGSLFLGHQLFCKEDSQLNK